MSIKIKTSIFIAFLTTFNLYTQTLASNLSVTDQNRLLGAVAREWESSNLREWLNSDKTTVDYTAIPPSYKAEAGFLSDKNFTQSERDAIAITKHGGAWQYSLSNTNNTKYISQRSVAHNDYLYNDKVFILNYTDLVNYIERNNQLMNLNTKYYSNHLKNTTNKQDKYPYIVNSGYVNSAYSGTNQMYSSTLTILAGRNQNNIVPALSLKPDYVLSNGIKASDLTIGQIVTFGKYNEEDIEWQVINISNDGYALLWATKIITIKEYDAQGDINPIKSNYINFDTYDVDIASGTGQNKSWETQKTISSYPVISIVNESVLTTPTNNTSITIQIKATDETNTIRKITLPDGTTINSDTASYTINQNGEFDIIVENSQGVITVRHIVTKAINTPAEVIIKTDKDENTKWTNKPVNVTITASNNGVYEKITSEKATGYGSVKTSSFPAWMPLNGKRVRITGTLYNKITDEDIVNYGLNMDAIIRFRCNYTQYSVSSLSPTYPIIKQISLAQLKEEGQIEIDEIFTIPNNVYNNLNFSIRLMDDNSSYMKTGYNWGISSFTFEILDKDDLKIEEITLPDGNIIKNDTASYIILNRGSYTFSVKDNRNKITSKTIEIDIDTVKPSINISYPTDFTKQNITLNIDTFDDLSGIKYIKLPNGEYRTNATDELPLSIKYNIITNGDYKFEISDFAGNTLSKTISIKNIDKVAPSTTYTLTPNTWTNGEVSIIVSTSDNISGIKQIILPDGSKLSSNSVSYVVNKNGIYQFLVMDFANNVSIVSVDVNIIDKKKPLINSITKTPNEEWSNRNVYINIDSID